MLLELGGVHPASRIEALELLMGQVPGGDPVKRSRCPGELVSFDETSDPRLAGVLQPLRDGVAVEVGQLTRESAAGRYRDLVYSWTPPSRRAGGFSCATRGRERSSAAAGDMETRRETAV